MPCARRQKDQDEQWLVQQSTCEAVRLCQVPSTWVEGGVPYSELVSEEGCSSLVSKEDGIVCDSLRSTSSDTSKALSCV